MLAGTDAGTGGRGHVGLGGALCCSVHSMGGVGGRGGTHTGTRRGTYTHMLHLPFSDLPLKKCPIYFMGPKKITAKFPPNFLPKKKSHRRTFAGAQGEENLGHSLQLCSGVSWLTVGASLITVGASFLTVGKCV